MYLHTTYTHTTPVAVSDQTLHEHGIFKREYPRSNLRNHRCSSCPSLNKGKENSAGDWSVGLLIQQPYRKIELPTLDVVIWENICSSF